MGCSRCLQLTLNSMDRTELFLHPVNRVEVPDYFEIIKEPMCWLYIDEKLEKNGYRNIADFQVSLSFSGFETWLRMPSGILVSSVTMRSSIMPRIVISTVSRNGSKATPSLFSMT